MFDLVYYVLEKHGLCYKVTFFLSFTAFSQHIIFQKTFFCHKDKKHRQSPTPCAADSSPTFRHAFTYFSSREKPIRTNSRPTTESTNRNG